MKHRKRVLDSDFYKNRYKKIINLAGPRYSPETNIDLPLSDIFHSLCRTKEFYNEIRKMTGLILKGMKYDKNDWDDENINKWNKFLTKTLCELYERVSDIKDYSSEIINWSDITRLTEHADSQLLNLIDNYKRRKQEIKDTRPESNGISYKPSPSEKIGDTIHGLRDLQATILDIDYLFKKSKAWLSNHPYLLIKGDAGIGKTHLLCDLYRVRTENVDPPLPTFLSFGEQYRNVSDFWGTFLHSQGLSPFFKNKTEFLKYLDCLATENCCRSLIMIDALNESSDDFWQSHFTGLLDDISSYKHIDLVVTIRTGFEDTVLTTDHMNRLECVDHTGFVEVEWQAVTKYFEYNDIPLPEFPILYPEFQNPLFLKLFCEAFRKRKQTRAKQDIFRGHEGSTYIFETFIDKVSRPLVRKYGLVKKNNLDVWNSIIKPMAKTMCANNSDRISEADLQSIILASHPQVTPSDIILDMEKLLLITRYPRVDDESSFDIRFPFQKFSDHLITRYIFDKYENEFGKKNKDITNAKRFFSRRRKLGKSIYRILYISLIEALSIQCPEHLKGIEFIEVAPYLMCNRHTALHAIIGFIDSLVWRKCSAFSSDLQNTNRIINKYVLHDERMRGFFFDALLTIAPIENHPYNALWLNDFLNSISMPRRDAFWSVFLHNQNNENCSVDRILKWARTENAAKFVTDNSLFLIGITLSWFLTTPNRFVRDRATKGLASLFIYRPSLIIKLLKNFEHIDDIYVIERLYAATYSCVLHNAIDNVNLEKLAIYVYKMIFRQRKQPKHILLRDYARGIIEIALSRGLCQNIDQCLIYPPYKSDWPKQIPSLDELREKYYIDDYTQLTREKRGYNDIWNSVIDDGDFSRYVIGTNSGSCSWTGRRINDNSKSVKQLFDDFVNGLSKKQKAIWDQLEFLISIRSLTMLKRIGSEKPEVDIDNEIMSLKSSFIASLSAEQNELYTQVLQPCLMNGYRINDPLETFDLSVAQSWIFNRVIELGYNPSIHNHFDAYVNSYSGVGRSEHKAERIGKKYQWIAYHEFMGMLSDNFKYKDDNWFDTLDHYSGPWEPYIRDIDPTLLIQNDEYINQSIPLKNWKTEKCVIKTWNEQVNDIKWLRMRRDIPDPLSLIEVIDDNLNKWLLLKANIHWQMPTPPENEKYDEPTRDILFLLKSCLIMKSDIPKVTSWWRKKRQKDNWMPESGSFYNIFIGEYPYSYAYECTKGTKDEWVTDKDSKTSPDIPLLITDDCYSNEFLLDCSYEQSRIGISLPCATLVKDIGLIQKYIDGRFYWDDKLVTSPLSIYGASDLSGLLFDKAALVSYLNAKRYTVIWSFFGEKRLIAHSNKSPGMLKINGIYWLNDNNNLEGLFTTTNIWYKT
ncbi:MAG: hypothetical protein KBG38_01995 [Candidatus Cloacimonas sp.]|nr:hypothetical protein [Candidatus Cloacimonas sp.]